MNQQPDKLFREKLHAYQVQVPVNAWSKVEAKLDKKNNKGLWLKIAASLLIVMVGAFVLWLSLRPHDNVQEFTAKKENVVKESPSKNNQPQPENSPKQKTTTEENQSGNPTAVNTEVKKNQKRKSEKKTGTVSPQHSTEEKITPVVEENVVEEIPVLEESVMNDNAVAQNNTEASPAEEKMKIVFSSNEINDKYLDKKSLAEATSEGKKPSTLKKLLDKAYDLKNNQNPFGDLRQMKDEILALNFRNEKQRSKN